MSSGGYRACRLSHLTVIDCVHVVHRYQDTVKETVGGKEEAQAARSREWEGH
jgi:hypothetical protein